MQMNIHTYKKIICLTELRIKFAYVMQYENPSESASTIQG